MKKTIIFILIFVVIVGIPVSKKYFSEKSLKEVETATLTKQKIKASILASGQFKHENEVKLSAEVIGKVSKLYVKEGDKVTKGQLLLEIDDEAFTAAVEQQQAVVDQQKIAIDRQKLVVENIQTQLERKTTLFKQKLLDKDSYEALLHQAKLAQVDLKSSFEMLKQVEASLEQSKDRLSKTKVVSPIDGSITSLDIKQGETAISGTTNISGSSLMTIADPASMLAEINVDEADISSVKLEQKAEIIAIAFTDEPLQGSVNSIASSAKIASGRQSLSFAVKLHIDNNHSLNLRPGMSCRAEIFTQGEKELLAIPINAIQTKEDNDNNSVDNYVFIVENDKAKKVKVKVGISDDSHQEILDGLEEGALIVTGPDKIIRHLKDGDDIKVISDK